jgi:hypothetical protein
MPLDQFLRANSKADLSAFAKWSQSISAPLMTFFFVNADRGLIRSVVHRSDSDREHG